MTTKDDRITPVTRVVAAIVVPFLILAFLILYFFPQLSGQRFAWSIQPNMTAMFMGAGYIGGAWLFANAVFGRRWHRVASGFPAVITFAASMLLATILHWDRFDLRHLPFLLWLGLYAVTPFLVLFVWLRNRVTDSGAPEADDMTVPGTARWSLLLLGILLLAFAVVGFFSPSWLIGVWQWKLAPLTARVMSGWFALLGVGGIVISRDSRWSAWKVGLQTIGLWQLLVLAAAYSNAEEFRSGLGNWYVVSVIFVLVGMVVLYVGMERIRRKRSVSAG
jgi:hypothetical protein